MHTVSTETIKILSIHIVCQLKSYICEKDFKGREIFYLDSKHKYLLKVFLRLSSNCHTMLQLFSNY